MSVKAQLHESPIKIFYRKLPNLFGQGIDWPLLDIGIKHNRVQLTPKLLALNSDCQKYCLIPTRNTLM